LPQLQPVLLDVTDSDSIAQATEHVAEWWDGAGLGALINNAGVGVGGPQESMATAEWRRALETNVIGTVAVTRAMLPLLRQSSRARIINMSSAYGAVAVPYLAPYCASKHAIEAISWSLRMELRPWRISVSVIAPTDVRTPIWDKMEAETNRVIAQLSPTHRQFYGRRLRRLSERRLADARLGLPVETVAKVVERVLESGRPRFRYAVGWEAHFLEWGSRWLPRSTLEWIIRRYAEIDAQP
jgi:NAD(P)-dependent dehydrogenase (short-subunit alcohol dehydrogenase family)